MSDWSAALCGGAGFFLCTLLFFSTFGTVAEPFGDFPTCLLRMFSVGAVAGICSTSIAAFVIAVWRAAAAVQPREAAVVRAACLAPIPFVVPVAAWSFCASFSSPDMNIASGKPPWMESPLAQFTGSCFWLPAFVAGWIALLTWTGGRLTAHYAAAPPTCRGCGYLLVGLENSRCPECGRFFSFYPANAPEALRGLTTPPRAE